MATDITRKRMTNSAVAVARRLDEVVEKVEKIETFIQNPQAASQAYPASTFKNPFNLEHALKVWDVLMCGDGSKLMVLEVKSTGIKAADWPRQTQPRMEDATGYTWEELQAMKARKV